MKPIRVANPDVEVKMNDNVETGHCPVSTKDTTRHKNPDTGVKMKPIEQKMKTNRVANPVIEVKMKPIGVADLNTGVKMKHTEQEMKPIGVGNPDVEVKMNETDLPDPDIEVKMSVTLPFAPDAEVKTINNEGGLKPHKQILDDRFCFETGHCRQGDRVTTENTINQGAT